MFCQKKEAPKPELRVDATAGTAGISGTTEYRTLTDAQKIALLRAEAHKRRLRWQVGCAPSCGDGDCGDETFFASAEDKRTPSDAYTIEAGARDWWAEYGPTQADAAYALYLAIQQSPNMKVRHEEKAVHKKLCPPELRGE